MILIATNIHAGSGEIVNLFGFAKNALEGTSNPQAARSSQAGCATFLCLAKIPYKGELASGGVRIILAVAMTSWFGWSPNAVFND